MVRLKFIVILFLFTLSIKSQKDFNSDYFVTDLDGQKVNLNQIIKEDFVTIITFWATWCHPCMQELDDFMDIQDKWKDKLKIIAISIDDSRNQNKIKSTIKNRKWEFLFYNDVNQEFFKSLNGSNVPMLIVVDKQKKIIFNKVGYVSGSETELIEKALNAQ